MKTKTKLLIGAAVLSSVIVGLAWATPIFNLASGQITGPNLFPCDVRRRSGLLRLLNFRYEFRGRLGTPVRFSFLSGLGDSGFHSMSTSDRPQRSSRHTRTASISRRRAASMSSSRFGRVVAPDPTSFTSTETIHFLFLA